METEKKEIFNKKLYIFIIFSFCCSMIYFKTSIISIILGIIALLFVFLFNKLNKKYHFFIFLLLSCIFIPINQVNAEQLYSPNEIKNAMLSLSWPEKPFSNSNYDYFMIYDEYGNVKAGKFHKYQVFYCSDIGYYYDFSNNYFYWTAEGCYTFKFDDLVYDEAGILVKDTYQASSAHTGAGLYFPRCSDPTLGLNDSTFVNCKQNYKILSANQDIKFRDDGFATIQEVFLYRKDEGLVYDEFGLDLGNVDGYRYISLQPQEQVVLYPKVLTEFEFYLFYKGHLDSDILDSVGSNISTSTHYSGTYIDEYYFKKIKYSKEDAEKKRGVYLTNFSKTPLIVGYNPDLFKLLSFNVNGLAVDSETNMTFSNTYNTIKSQNNIVDSNDKLGSFDDLISNPKNLASKLIGVFQTIGQLVTIFFSSMPDFISQGLILLFVILIAIAILKALL